MDIEKGLYTKSIYKKRDPEDATHVSIMSRHTLEDGITPDENILPGESFDEWMRELAPPTKLVGSYYRKEIEWDEYESAYLDFLRSEEIAPLVEVFARRCTEETITLLCVEDKADNCHRRLLAEELQRKEPGLRVVHK